MAKNYKLIPGETNNWEVAAFLLIDYLYISNFQLSHIEFTRSDMHSSAKALDFIENLLGPIGYVVDNTAVPDIPLRPVFRGYEESAFVNFLEQSHDGTAGWPRYGGPPAAG